MYTVAVSEADPDAMYAGTVTAGIYASPADGESWIQGLSGQHHRARVWASPHDPGTAYTKNERTDDAGRHWYGGDWSDRDRHGPIGGQAGENTYVYDLAWDPFDGDVIYAGADEGFYRTLDDGRSWGRLRLGAGVEVAGDGRPIAVHPERRGVVAAAFVGRDDRVTLVRTDDRGDSWSVLTKFPDVTRDVRGLAYGDPSRDELYFAINGRGVYRHADGEIEAVTDDLPPISFAPAFSFGVAADARKLYFVAGPSRDPYPTGSWWERRRLYVYDSDADAVSTVTPPEKPSAVATHPDDPSTVFVGGRSWVFRSRDGGETWAALDDGFVDHHLATVGVDPSNPGTVTVGSICSTGVSVSHDRGRTYEWKRSGLEPWHDGEEAEHYVMQVDAAGERSYATTAAGLLVSEDDGETWRLLDNSFSGEGGDGPTTHLHGLATHPDAPGTVYVGTGRGGTDGAPDVFEGATVWRSSDGGRSWDERTGGFPTDADTTVVDLEVHPGDRDTVYAATNAEDFGDVTRGRGVGLWKSTDGGRHWKRLDLEASNLDAVSVAPTDADTVYASTPGAVYRSRDAGRSWESVLAHRAKALLAHPTEPGVVFAGAQKHPEYWDVLLSRDGGETWAEAGLTIQVGLEPDAREYDAAAVHSDYWARRGQIMWFAFDDANSLLYGATRGAGLWRADVGGVGL